MNNIDPEQRSSLGADAESCRANHAGPDVSFSSLRKEAIRDVEKLDCRQASISPRARRKIDKSSRSDSPNGVRQLIDFAAGFPLLDPNQEVLIARSIAENRREWERALFMGDLTARYAFRLLQRYVDSGKRIDRFCEPIPGKQERLKLRMEQRLSVVQCNLKVLRGLLHENRELYDVAVSKKFPDRERRSAWRDLGRNKEKVATLLSECKIRFRYLQQIHDRFVQSSHKTLLSCAKVRGNRQEMVKGCEQGALAEARKEAVRGLVSWRESPASLAARAEKCLRSYAAMDASMKELTQSNLLLVISRAEMFDRRYEGNGSWMESLIGCGFEGLQTAVEKFDLRRGCRFTTAAVPWIDQAMRSEIVRLQRRIHVPEHAIAKLRRFEQQAGSPEELERVNSAALGYKHLKQVKTVLNQMVSLDASSQDAEDRQGFGLTIPAPGEEVPKLAFRAELRGLVQTAITETSLTDRERTIITWRFYDDLTLLECAGRLSVSKERVRQIEAEAVGKLREGLGRHFDTAKVFALDVDPRALSWD